MNHSSTHSRTLTLHGLWDCTGSSYWGTAAHFLLLFFVYALSLSMFFCYDAIRKVTEILSRFAFCCCIHIHSNNSRIWKLKTKTKNTTCGNFMIFCKNGKNRCKLKYLSIIVRNAKTDFHSTSGTYRHRNMHICVATPELEPLFHCSTKIVKNCFCNLTDAEFFTSLVY